MKQGLAWTGLWTSRHLNQIIPKGNRFCYAPFKKRKCFHIHVKNVSKSYILLIVQLLIAREEIKSLHDFNAESAESTQATFSSRQLWSPLRASIQGLSLKAKHFGLNDLSTGI